MSVFEIKSVLTSTKLIMLTLYMKTLDSPNNDGWAILKHGCFPKKADNVAVASTEIFRRPLLLQALRFSIVH